MTSSCRYWIQLLNQSNGRILYEHTFEPSMRVELKHELGIELVRQLEAALVDQEYLDAMLLRVWR